MLPSYINKDDIYRRFQKAGEFYRSYNIPVGIIRKDPRWCQFVMWTDIGDQWFDGKLYNIYLPEDHQLSSVKELFEEVCDELQIPFRG